MSGGEAPIDPRFANLDANATIELCSSLADYGEAGGLSRDLMMQVGRYAEARYAGDLEVLLAVARMYLLGGEAPRAQAVLVRGGRLGVDEERVLPLLANVLALLGDGRTAEQVLRETPASPAREEAPAEPSSPPVKKTWAARDVRPGLPVVDEGRSFTPTMPMTRPPGLTARRATTPLARNTHATPPTPPPRPGTPGAPIDVLTEVSRKPITGAGALPAVDTTPGPTSAPSSPGGGGAISGGAARSTRIRVLEPDDPRRRLDPYEIIGEIASGGMATVFLGRLAGAGGFSRFVAIKQLHPHLAREEQFVQMFLDEARLAAGIHNPHVVPILEVGMSKAGYFLVMEFIEGDTLAGLTVRALQSGATLPPPVALRIVLDALTGLHAAHQLTDAEGQHLGLIHRDCTPQNILVGADGSARLTDFGVARAASRLAITRPQQVKGKVAYLSPEQAHAMDLDRRSDLFTMGIVLWEALAGRSLFQADTEAATLSRLVSGPIPSVRSFLPDLPEAIDEVCRRALHRDRSRRFRTAAEMGEALEAAAQADGFGGVASSRELGKFVEATMGAELIAQREAVRAGLLPSSAARAPASSHPSHPPPSLRAGGGGAAEKAPASSSLPLSAAAPQPVEPPVEKTLPAAKAPVREGAAADPPAQPDPTPAPAAAPGARPPPGLLARLLTVKLSMPRGIALAVLVVMLATSPLWLRVIGLKLRGHRAPAGVAQDAGAEGQRRPRVAAESPAPASPTTAQPAWDEGEWPLPDAGGAPPSK